MGDMSKLIGLTTNEWYDESKQNWNWLEFIIHEIVQESIKEKKHRIIYVLCPYFKASPYSGRKTR